MVTDLNGEIAHETELGIFADDTRFLSYYAVYADGQQWHLLSSSPTDYYSARFYLTNLEVDTEFGVIEPNSLAMVIDREICTAISEKIVITNHSLKAARFNLEIAMRSDFADIFEVRAHSFRRRGQVSSSWNDDECCLVHSYANQDFQRHFVYRVIEANPGAKMANGRLSFQLDLDAGASWQLKARHELVSGPRSYVSQNNGQENKLEKFKKLHQEWQEQATELTSSNEEVYRLFNQSVSDLGALRLHQDPLDKDSSIASWAPAAGVPWYVTVFGRDSLITGMQSMLVNPRFVLGSLKRLGQLQSTESNDFKDAKPGKIAHEIRLGELAHFNKIPQTPYYGTADATSLYLIGLHEAWRWLGNEDLLKEYLPVAEKCLAWIDQYGDIDGDGFQEYLKLSEKGLENQGWKDSDDAIVYPDGSVVRGSKALCELQGYVYDAWLRMAEIFKAVGRHADSDKLLAKAEDLKCRFNEKFWSEPDQFFALALDGEKKQVNSLASNIGHGLWSGIVDEDHASKVVQRLMEPHFFSGWGIRSLSAKHPAFNPHSYHCGSIWPHDNGIIALGLKRYGFTDEVGKVARDISRAASYFEGNRLPELYAGIQRDEKSFPVQYAKANMPQAWAAGSVFHLLKAILGLQADAPKGVFYVDPVLPSWLNDLCLKKVQVGNSTLELKFWKSEDKTQWDAKIVGEKIFVSERKMTPNIFG